MRVGSLLAARLRDVVVLADTKEAPWARFWAVVAGELRGTDCRIGVGGRRAAMDEFPHSYQEAQLALNIQKAVGGREHLTLFDDLGVYQVLATANDSASLERFVHEWLGALMDYDATHGSQLVLTLSEYLDRGGNYDATARALSVHRNTLKYRLRRIRDVSGHDLGIPDTQFNLQLASRAWRTTQALRRNLSIPAFVLPGQLVGPDGTAYRAARPRMLGVRQSRGMGCVVTRTDVELHAYVHQLEEHLRRAVFGDAPDPESAVLLVRGALAADDEARATDLAEATEKLVPDGLAAGDMAAAAAHVRGLVDQDPPALERAAVTYVSPLGRAWATEDAGVAWAQRGNRAAAVDRLHEAHTLYEQLGGTDSMGRVRARLRATGSGCGTGATPTARHSAGTASPTPSSASCTW